MKTPATWIPISKEGDVIMAIYVPAENVVSVLMRTSAHGIHPIVTELSLHLEGEPGYMRVASDLCMPVAEALGILEALGQKAPPPAGVIEDARRYRVLKGLLKEFKNLNISHPTPDTTKVRMPDGAHVRGSNLDDAIDQAKGYEGV
jgi:hypothetical protein